MLRTNGGRRADWEELLPYTMLGHNSSEQASAHFSAFQLVHAVPPTILAAMRQTVEALLDTLRSLMLQRHWWWSVQMQCRGALLLPATTSGLRSAVTRCATPS